MSTRYDTRCDNEGDEVPGLLDREPTDDDDTLGPRNRASKYVPQVLTKGRFLLLQVTAAMQIGTMPEQQRQQC